MQPFAGASSIPTAGPHVLFDNFGAITGTFVSQELTREAPNAIVEVFPTAPGSLAIVQVIDAGPFGSLTACTDSNGYRPDVASYTKFLVKGVMDRVAVSLDVLAGTWSVWLTFVWESSDRAQFYDRNGLANATTYDANAVPPHLYTQRTLYTVPPGRKSWVDGLYLRVGRRTAPTTLGMATAQATYISAAGGGACILGEAFLQSATPGDVDRWEIAPFGFMAPGDQVVTQTADASVGGDCDYATNLKWTEFDY